MQINSQVQMSCVFATGVTDGSPNDNNANCRLVKNGVGDCTLFIGYGIVGSQRVQLILTILIAFSGAPAIYQIVPVTDDQLQILFFDAVSLPTLVPVDCVFTLCGLGYPG